MSKPEAAEAVTHKNLAVALAAFQADLPSVAKGNTAKVTARDGGRGYEYDYADLTDVSAVVLPALAKHGLAWFTAVRADGDQINLDWSLMHGATEEGLHGSVPVGRRGENWQSLGGSITYARRYCLVAVSGVAPGGDDNDGEGARAGSERPQAQAGAQRAPRPQAPVVQESGELPNDLYRLSSLTSLEDTQNMYRQARAAGHLNLTVPMPDADGNLVDTPFSEVLTIVGNRFKAQDAPMALSEDDHEAAAIAAHEAEQERLEAEAAAAEAASDEAAR